MILRHAPRYPESMVRLRGIYPIHPAELLPTSVENPAETPPKRNLIYGGKHDPHHGKRLEKSLRRAPGRSP